MRKSAVLIGASGLVGRHLLHHLIADETYDRLLTIGRRTLSEYADERKLTQQQMELDAFTLAVDGGAPLPFLEELRGDSIDVFCTLGTTMKAAGSKRAFELVDLHAPVAAAQAGARYGARQFLIVTAVGADAGSGIYYNKIKGRVEDSLRTVCAAGKYIAVHIFRPSLLLGERSGQGLRIGEEAGKIAGAMLGPFLSFGGLRRYKPIQGRTVARAMLRCAHAADSGMHVYENETIAKLGE